MSKKKPNSTAGSGLLERYRQKRRLDGTPEPFGGAPVHRNAGWPQFMIHHHAARNTHYDLRLEMEGVLRSWAVPKGPSPNVKDKRFAAFVEDHPLEYGVFEGKIPDGNYGAGWTIVWDKGFWKPLADPIEGLRKGKLLFELHGCKLHGKWTLVRLKNGDKDWLFIKEYDDHADESLGTEDYPAGSVLTGLSLKDLEEEYSPAARVLKSLARSKLPKQTVNKPKPMLATKNEPFNRNGWLFEIKYDGYRLIGLKQSDNVKLLSRNGKDLSQTFPEITFALASLPYEHIVIDGEAVVHDDAGLPSFSNMQKRGRLTDASAIADASRRLPATLYAFDLLAFGEFDLRGMALTKRKDHLLALLPEAGLIKYSAHIKKDGVAMFHAAAELGLEGVVGKRADSRYTEGRSDNWLKVRKDLTDDFVVMGYRAKGRDVRSIMVGQYIDGKLTYSGNVGSGLNQTTRNTLIEKLEKQRTIKTPVGAPQADDLHWKPARLVCEVKFTEFTPAGHLRHPVLVGLRDDKKAKECVRQSLNHELAEPDVKPPRVDKSVHLSNLDKLLWPDDKFTKEDMLLYYEAVSPWLLPWIKDRPLVLTRYPDGIDGKSFYQKDAPDFAPDWMQIHRVWSESTEREIGYFVANDVESIMYIANMASIPLHVHHSRVTQTEMPDWCVLDLDPKEAPFKDVITIAKAIKVLCDELALPGFVKTSGSTGLHILLPLNNQFTFEQSRVLGELLARIIVHRLPDIATIARSPARREGKVYVDYLQNGGGKTIASSYCIRPLPGAPVSMPLRWSEVNSKLKPDGYHIKNAIPRLKRWKKDPALDVLSAEVDLLSVLEQLTETFQAIN